MGPKWGLTRSAAPERMASNISATKCLGPGSALKMLKDFFSTRDVLDLTGVSARQLQWWDERRVVVPERHGRNRVYSAADLVDILVIGQLRQRSVSLAQVRRVLRLLRNELHMRLSDLVTGNREYHLLLAGKRMFLESDSKQIIELLSSSMQPMLLISLSDAIKPLRLELKDLLKTPEAKLAEKKPAQRARRAGKQRVTA